MKLSDVSNDDGRACAQLLAFLKAGSWQLKGSDVDELMRVRAWVAGLAQQMAAQLKASAVPTPPPVDHAPAASIPSEGSGFRIKAMGPIAQSSSPKKRKK